MVGPCEVCKRPAAAMSVDSKIIEATIVGDDNAVDLCKETGLKSLKPILLLFLVLELLPLLIDILEGFQKPFFSPSSMNADPHVYHHIHFLIYGFPVGFSVWFIMDRRVKELERQLSKDSPAKLQVGDPALSPGARLTRRLSQAVLFFVFWLGWDDLKYHYLSKHWSLVHEILKLFY